MRYMILSLTVLAMLSSQDLFASPKTDSVVTFLGGTHAKFVWPRFAWCKEDYTPKTWTAAKADGYSLMLMDTRAGAERALLSGQTYSLNMVRISRSGKWATFVDSKAKKTYIVDITSASPTRNDLLSFSAGCTYWQVGAWWIDPANGAEYVYALDGVVKDGTGIYKVKINANGTAALPGTKLSINSSARIDGTFSVSADGKKLGGAFPWPDTYILDIPSGALTSRHHSGEAFGCQPNIAPDNSYRFFHCQGEHQGVYMFPPLGVSGADWFLDLGKNLAGYPNGSGVDFMAPRWTNHVQYYTAQCPMGDNYEIYCGDPMASTEDPSCWMSENGSLWSKTAAQVKTQLNLTKMPRFVIGKFAADFKTQEKSFAVAIDARYLQYGGDAWLCNGVTDGNCTGTSSRSAIRGNPLHGLSVVRNGALVNVHTNAGTPVRITDARGGIVRQVSGNGLVTIDTRTLAPGAYYISTSSGVDRLAQPVVVDR